VITSAPHNRKGNRENKRIMDLHESVLAHSGGSWDAPPSRVTWSSAHAEERGRIIDSYRDAPEWGFKDPRTLITLDFWREVLPDIVFVGTFRHPRLVADSLLRRNGSSLERWLDLWAAYAERLVALHQAAPFPIVRFDVDEAAYRKSLAVVVERLGLRGRPSPEFFEPTLRHQLEGDADLPARVTVLYETLCAIAVR
jgi:hypothetical protein